METNNRKSITLFQLNKYAFRNLTRNKVKNLILIVTITAGLLAYVFLNSLLLGMRENSVKLLLRYEMGAIQIMNEQYFVDNKNPIEDTVPFPKELEDELSAQGFKTSPLLFANGSVNLPSPPYPAEGSFFFNVMAIDTERDMFMQKSLQEKIFFPSSPPLIADLLANEGVLISTWLAERISAEIGHPLILVTKGRGGFVEQLDLEITGIFDTTDARVDRTTIIISYATAEDYLFLDGEYTTINLIRNFNVPDSKILTQDKQRVQKAISTRLSTHLQTKVNSYTWDEVEIQRNDKIAWDYPQGMAYLYTIFIFIIAATGIANSIFMNIKSRHRAIGTMQAFGMTQYQVMILYILEMFFVGVISSIFAIIGGIGLMAFLVNIGLDYTAMMQESTFGLITTGVIYGSWDMGVFFNTTIIGIVFTVAIGTWIVWRMKKQYSNVIDLLRAQT